MRWTWTFLRWWLVGIDAVVGCTGLCIMWYTLLVAPTVVSLLASPADTIQLEVSCVAWAHAEYSCEIKTCIFNIIKKYYLMFPIVDYLDYQFQVLEVLSISSPTARFTRSRTKETKYETQTKRRKIYYEHVVTTSLPASTYDIDLIMVEQKQDKTSAQQTKTTGKNSSSTQSRKPFFQKMRNVGKRFRKAKQERAEKKVCSIRCAIAIGI